MPKKPVDLELEKGDLMKRIRNYIPVLIPLIVSAIRRSLELAEAMESRAWGASKKRTNLYLLKLHKGDYALLAITIASVGDSDLHALLRRNSQPLRAFSKRNLNDQISNLNCNGPLMSEHTRFGPAGVPPMFRLMGATTFDVPKLLHEEGLGRI